MPLIPVLTNDSFRILGLRNAHPQITAIEIAEKTNMAVQDVYTHLDRLRQAKFLRSNDRTLQVVK